MPLRVERPHQRLLLTNARQEAFTPHARSILSRLGYAILTEDEVAKLSDCNDEDALDDLEVDMLVSDEHRLAELQEFQDAEGLPVILLTGRRGLCQDDPYVVAAVKRPAGLHDLYRVIQHYFEEMPRSTPRVSTRLRAKCRREEHEFGVDVVSLSENGCLMRCSEQVRLGSRLDLALELPRFGNVELEAEIAYQVRSDTGLVFNATPARVRDVLRSYVVDALSPGAIS
jgi:hypothetical protein